MTLLYYFIAIPGCSFSGEHKTTLTHFQATPHVSCNLEDNISAVDYLVPNIISVINTKCN